MLSYSDYILALKPWSYCRLNEPSGNNIYCDSSKNGNHVYSGYTIDGALPSATNRQYVSFTGEPDIAGIKPLYSSVSSSVESQPSQNRPQIHIPILRTSFPVRYSAAENINVAEEWGEVIINGSQLTPNINACYQTNIETVLTLGPIRVFTETVTGCTNNNPTLQSFRLYIGLYYMNSFWDGNYTQLRRDFLQVFYLTPPTTTFRLTVGIKQTDYNSAIISVAINGEHLEDSPKTVTLSQEDYFDLWNHNSYGFCAIHGDTTFSNLSLFINSSFPTNSWLQLSQEALENLWQGEGYNHLVKLTSEVPYSALLFSYPGTLLAILDQVLLFGDEQRFISEVISEDDNVVKLVFRMISGPTVSNGFHINDIIEVNGSSQNSLNGVWSIKEIGYDFIKIQTTETVVSENSDWEIMLKRIPIGNGFWKKEIINNKVSYKSLASNEDKIFLIDDSNKNYSQLQLANSNGTNVSQNVFFKRHYKSPVDVGYDWVQWCIGGDDLRLFFFIAFRSISPSFSQTLIYGDFKDIFSQNDFYTLLLGYSEVGIIDINFNQAFHYPKWEILDSGHLLCRTSYDNVNQIVNSSIVSIDSDNNVTNRDLRADYGHHIYPYIQF